MRLCLTDLDLVLPKKWIILERLYNVFCFFTILYKSKYLVITKIEKFIKDPIDTTVDTVKEVFRREPKAKEVKRYLGLPPESENEISTADSIGSAINSGLIKIPKGVVNFGTLVYDALQEEGIPIEQSATFRNLFSR